jgi:chromosome partitioning protein
LTEILTFANVKGGSGKSTLCVNLAASLRNGGHSVSVIDADKQNCAFDWIISSSDENLKQISVYQHSKISNLSELYSDFILIDTQGSLTKEMAHYLNLSSIVITPCKVSRDDIVGQGWVEIFLQQLSKDGKKIPCLTVLNGVNKRSAILSHVIAQLSNDRILTAKTTIGQRVCYAETNVNKCSVIGYNKSATLEIQSLMEEILLLLSKEK